ncbi:hypothetical protein [Elioraea sp.]|uniref:hypothetical protein n=1 Tax=Elioraea sp. TaxID=2185103 RepID=UPI0025BDFD95|nr:hypothetical protein [Elioraea sp.]
MDVRTAIDRLGGPSVVAERVRANVKQVWAWGSRDSVPAEFQVPFWEACKAAGVNWAPPRSGGLTLAPAGAA